MNNHIIIGTGRRCLCGMFEGKPLGCADIIKSIETIKRHGQSWDGGLLARLMETLIEDVDKPQTREEIDDHEKLKYRVEKWKAEKSNKQREMLILKTEVETLERVIGETEDIINDKRN